ncbi:MAG: glycosyltransferase [Oscillospiraceae bacterium]|nr:glycosyltransferase [Oscillospiraceae bacterium]
MKEPFSVSMCVYGGDNPEWFKIAVESIIHQTAQPNEVVLVVDGPVPDELNVVIKSYEQNPIFKIICLTKNQGHGNARRIGLEHCTYELVALMDADDISASDRFEKQLKRFSTDNNLTIVGGNIIEFIDSPDHAVGRRNVPGSDSAIKTYMKKRCPMNQMTVMFKKTEVQAVGGYIDWYCDEDYYLWLRLALKNAKFANVDDVLVNVRVGKEMYQRRGGKKYFTSEAKLQKFMLEKKVISFPQYCINVIKRLIIQVLLPNNLRGWVFQKFAREKA